MKFLTSLLLGAASLACVATAQAAPMQYTSTLEGPSTTIQSSLAKESFFKFNGTAGDSVTITVNRLEAAFDPAFLLYSGADEKHNLDFLAFADDELAPATNGQFGDAQLLDFVLPETGSYSLLVFSFLSLNAGADGVYDFSLSISGLTGNSTTPDTSAEVSEPLSALLFGLGFCGFMGARAKRKA